MKAVSLLTAVLVAFGLGCGGSSNITAISNNSAAAQATPINSLSAGTQTVKIDSPDTVVIVGTFYEAEKPNSPALLLLHQWQSDRHSYDEFAKRMHAKGFAVLSIDGRGFGESTKKADGSMVAAGRTDADVKGMLGDVSAAFDFLGKQKSVDPARAAIVGASYGSSLALLYGSDHPKGAVIALISPGLNYFGNMPTERALQKFGSDCAIFMAAAKDDEESAKAVDTLVSEWVQPEKITRVMKDSGGHGTALFSVGLADDLERFLRTYLIKH